MGAPFMSMRFWAMSGSPSSLGRPMPSKTLPSISGATASSMLWPKKRAFESLILRPCEPSKS